ncbi:RNA polymerase sigma factor [Caulobacter hibisci]|uniref:RNA polymerase sigma factor n=1 Tax=Caulobacter hibisci TaxID=2035993 RepID=A0ABS0T7D0_9CAUL|nr:RNA polymerase sigma factor [Caulobacter hibisci]
MDGSTPAFEPSPKLSAALDRVFRRYHGWLSTMLRKRYGAAAAEDLAQDTFLRAARYRFDDDVRYPKALLMRIADNLARDQQRRDLSRPLDNVDDETLGSVGYPAPQVEAVTFKEVLLALPPELRDVFILSHVEGLTYAEIARLKGLPLTTVHHRMRKALERVSAAMRDEQD